MWLPRLIWPAHMIGPPGTRPQARETTHKHSRLTPNTSQKSSLALQSVNRTRPRRAEHYIEQESEAIEFEAITGFPGGCIVETHHQEAEQAQRTL
jgi:hypothetical protein